MKIKKILQKFFKNFFYIFFKIIYGNVHYKGEAYDESKIKIIEINSNKILKYDKKKYKLYQIPYGRIYNDNVQNVAIINDKNIVEGASYQQINGELKSSKYNVCIKIGTPRIKKKFSGRILNLAQGASGHNNYSHWLLDILPKFKLYSEIFSYNDLNYIYLNSLNSFQKSSIEMLNLKSLKLIDSNKYRHIECDELIAVQHPSYFKGFILDQAQYIPEWIIFWLRENYLNKSSKISTHKKIFIDRSKSIFKHCQIINYQETIDFLKEKNFDILKLEDLSFSEQIYTFKNAELIVSAHGAGLTNLVFSKENSRALEIRPSKPGYAHQNKVYERISKINNLNYKLYSTPYQDKKNLNGDILININKLNFLLNDF